MADEAEGYRIISGCSRHTHVVTDKAKTVGNSCDKDYLSEFYTLRTLTGGHIYVWYRRIYWL